MAKHPEHQESLHEQCPFCSIIAGKDQQRQRIFYEDQSVVAMLVNSPRTPGHFIVYPKIHAAELNDMQSELGNFFVKVHELAEDAIKKLSAPAYELKLNNNIYRLENDPRHVGHIHMHVVPRYTEEVPNVEVNSTYFEALVLKLIADSVKED